MSPEPGQEAPGSDLALGTLSLQGPQPQTPFLAHEPPLGPPPPALHSCTPLHRLCPLLGCH